MTGNVPSWFSDKGAQAIQRRKDTFPKKKKMMLEQLDIQCCCCSVAKLYLTLQPHGLQHAKLPCPSLSPRVCSNSCPLSWWCHPIISSSVTLFSSCPRSFPASGSFTMNQLFASGGQSIGASASVSALPMNIQDWFPLGLIGLICCPRDSQESSPTPQLKSID